MSLSDDVLRSAAAGIAPPPPRKAGRGASIVLPVSGLPPGVGDVLSNENAVLLIEPARRFGARGPVPDEPGADEPLDFAAQAVDALLRRTLSSGFPRTTAVWLGARRNGPWTVGLALRNAVRGGRLVPLQWAADAAREIEARGADRVLRELGICGLKRREALIVEACAPWLGEAEDARTLVRLAAAVLHACRRHHDGPLLCVAPAHFKGEPLADHFARLTGEESSGDPLALAVLYAEDGRHPIIEVQHWPRLSGPPLRRQVYGLVARRVGGRDKVGWQADGSALALDAQLLLESSDVDRVMTVPVVAQTRFGPPAGWELFETVEALEAACRHAVAATVVLPYQGADDYAALAHRIHRLRRAHPRALKIIVRELGERLRHGQESVLLRLGANQVVYRDVSLSRLEQAVQESRERLYQRQPPADAQTLVDAIAPEPVRGYLPPQPFCATARRMLARALDAQLGHSLIRLRLRGAVAHLDALAALRFERDGDLVTATGDEVAIFLFGCQQADAHGTLSRLLSVKAADLASDVSLVTMTIDLNMALESIAAQAHVNPPTDWTGALRERQQRAAQAEAQAQAAQEEAAGEPGETDTLPLAAGDVHADPAWQADGLQLPPGTRVLVPHRLGLRERVH
jgi:cellulose biosynthesis protein BcsE